MRRPSPLPQAPSAPAPSAPPSRSTGTERPIADDGDEVVGSPAHTDDHETTGDDASLAPVLALTGERMQRPALPEPARRDTEDDDAAHAETSGDPDPARPVRLRDVWKAARARRRALRAEVRRFTGRQRRRRITWIVSLSALVLLVAGSIVAAYSPLFGVERISVVGTAQLDAATVEAALAGQLGRPLPLVDESAVKAALVGFPLVETYALEARPPHELVVRIVERTPIGVVESTAGYTLVDAAGVALSTTETPPAGQPIVTVAGGTGTPAFTAAGHIVRALPADIRAQVTEVTATTPDDVTLRLGGTNTTVVWGSAEESATKAAVLQKMMVQRPPSGVSSYDVSSPTAIIVR